MGRSNKLISLIILFFASFSILVIFQLNGFIDAFKDRLYETVSMIIFIEETADEEDINNLGVKLTENKNIILVEYNDSNKVFEQLEKDSIIADQLKILRNEFKFPANYILQFKEFNVDNIKKYATELEDNKIIKHIDINFILIGKAMNIVRILNISRRSLIYIGPVFVIFLFYLSGYFSFLTFKNDLIFCNAIFANKKIIISEEGKHQLNLGLLTGLLAAAVYYLITIFVTAKFSFSISNILICVILTGVLNLFSCRINCYFR